MFPYDPTVAEAREEAYTEAAEKYASGGSEGRFNSALQCDCGGDIEWDPGHPDTRHEPGVPPRWYCGGCGLSFVVHPAIVRAFVAGARFVEAGNKAR